MISKYAKFKNYITFIFILKIFKGKLIFCGNVSTKFFKNLFYLVKYQLKCHLSFSYFLTIALLNVCPFLKLYKIKLHKKSKKKIDKVKHISIFVGLKLAINWLFNLINPILMLDMDKFINEIFFELCDAYYMVGRLYQKKFEYYKICLDTRFFIK